MRILVVSSLLLFGVLANSSVLAQSRSGRATRKQSRPRAPLESSAPIELLGIRPGLSMDSIRSVVRSSGATMREVTQDSLTRAYADHSLKIYIIDSIICRLTYMRLTFVFDESGSRLRRLSIVPRTSSIAAGQSDDVSAVLLLYFGERWGAPEVNFDPPAYFRWHTGNIEVRGYIKRGYPLWVLEG